MANKNKIFCRNFAVKASTVDTEFTFTYSEFRETSLAKLSYRKIVVIVASILLIACISAAAQLPEKPSAKDFPRIIIGSVMQWSTPYSLRFIPGGGSRDAGFYENAPLIARPDSETKVYKVFSSQYFRDLAAAGIDAIDHCYFDNMSLDMLYTSAEEARESGTGIKVLPMMDNMPKDGPMFPARLWENTKLREHPNLLKVGRCPVVMTYDYHGPEKWRERIANAEKAGGRFFIITDTYGGGVNTKVDDVKFRDGVAQVDGVYDFINHAMGLVGHGILPDLMRFGKSFTPPKVVGASIAPDYISSTRVGNLLDPRGTWIYRRYWIEVIQNNPDFVYLATLNDYSESEQECSVNDTYTFLDMCAYFGERWKKGTWNEQSKNQAFLSYRKAVAASEPVEFELVLLRPDITGDETEATIKKRFSATVALTLPDGLVVPVKMNEIEILPGHIAWRGWAPPLIRDGYAVPHASIVVDGNTIPLPQGNPAAFSIVRNGEQVARKWLHVPLHRVYPAKARIAVNNGNGNQYPRNIIVEGVPWDDVECGVIERDANSVSRCLQTAELRKGFTEEFYAGSGWAPMLYSNGALKRNIVDQVDRYMGVLRMKNERFLYPTPALVESPHDIKNEPYEDPAMVLDLKIAPGDKLIDQSWLKRDITFGGDTTKNPRIMKDNGDWYMRFDGIDDAITVKEPFTLPPGPLTVELWIRPRSMEVPEAIVDQRGTGMAIGITKNNTIVLLRQNQKRELVPLYGSSALTANVWHHIAGVFTGAEIRLYVDGKPDGNPVTAVGLRTDEVFYVGQVEALAQALGNDTRKRNFAGDIGMLRIRQRYLTGDEISAIYRTERARFP